VSARRLPKEGKGSRVIAAASLWCGVTCVRFVRRRGRVYQEVFYETGEAMQVDWATADD
jgi:hypothetical protein